MNAVVSKYILLFLTILLWSFNTIDRQSYTHKIKNKTALDKFSNESNLKIVTWNIKDLGRTKDEKEIIQIAKILRDYDLVAIQEVVAKDPAGAKSVAKIVDELNRMGNKWDYRISDPTNSPSVYMSERYAFLWKTSKIDLLTRAYLDKDLENLCVREPFIGKFRQKKENTPFFVINFHSRKHNDNPEEEIILFKNYHKKLKSEHVFLVGDFNLDENHIVWNDFYCYGYKSAVNGIKTTLKMHCKEGKYLNHSIDNIYYNSLLIEKISSDHVDFVKACENLEKARLISDHLPVFLECKIKQN